MKRLFLILALGAALMCTTSCSWVHETFYPVDKCAIWYLNQILKASERGDMVKAAERYEQMEEWYDQLNYVDQIKADIAAESWSDIHDLDSYDFSDFDIDDLL